MEESNIRNTKYIFNDLKNKVFKLNKKDIADPWYTRDFQTTFNEINEGIDNLLKKFN